MNSDEKRMRELDESPSLRRAIERINASPRFTVAGFLALLDEQTKPDESWRFGTDRD